MGFSQVMLRLLALAVQVKAARELRSAGRPAGRSLTAAPDPPLPAADSFRAYCETLSPAQLYMATMVMYTGRGDFGSSFDVLECYEQLSDTFQSPDWAVRQMLEKLPLPDYYATGILKLDEMRVNIDDLC